MRPSFPRSLRWRLTAFVAAVMLVSAGLSFAVVYVNTGSQLRAQTDHDLTGDIAQLVQSVRPYRRLSLAAAYRAARAYVDAQPYSDTSTLLFVLIPGEPAISSQPSGTATDAALRRPHVGYSTHHVPGSGKLRFLEQEVRIDGRRSFVGVAEPLAIVARAQHGVARAFVFAAALSLVLALTASYLAGARVTAPLRRMAGVAALVDGGDLEPRMEESTARGEEVRVLADAFNHMLDRLESAFQGQREFIADASHELRTPLTVIRGQLEVLAATDSPPADEVLRVEHVVQAEVTRMSRLVDDLLLLTAAEHVDFLRVEMIDLPEFVTDLWDGLSLTAERQFELGPVPSGMLRADPDRLAQALRNLGRNAIDHTTPQTGLVRLEVAALPAGRIRFAVVDDGPGIPASERERVFERLYRTDPSRSRLAGGAGLGLAIVRAIVEAHGGTVSAGAGPNGRGAAIGVVLPGFTAG